MYKIYGSAFCRDCVECKYNFEYYKIEFEYIDINESLKNLKEFLKMRDESPIFDEAKKNNWVGIPVIIDEEGNLNLSYEKILKEKGLKLIEFKDIKITACNVDGTGC